MLGSTPNRACFYHGVRMQISLCNECIILNLEQLISPFGEPSVSNLDDDFFLACTHGLELPNTSKFLLPLWAPADDLDRVKAVLNSLILHSGHCQRLGRCLHNYSSACVADANSGEERNHFLEIHRLGAIARHCHGDFDPGQLRIIKQRLRGGRKKRAISTQTSISIPCEMPIVLKHIPVAAVPSQEEFECMTAGAQEFSIATPPMSPRRPCSPPLLPRQLGCCQVDNLDLADTSDVNPGILAHMKSFSDASDIITCEEYSSPPLSIPPFPVFDDTSSADKGTANLDSRHWFWTLPSTGRAKVHVDSCNDDTGRADTSSDDAVWFWTLPSTGRAKESLELCSDDPLSAPAFCKTDAGDKELTISEGRCEARHDGPVFPINLAEEFTSYHEDANCGDACSTVVFDDLAYVDLYDELALAFYRKGEIKEKKRRQKNKYRRKQAVSSADNNKSSDLIHNSMPSNIASSIDASNAPLEVEHALLHWHAASLNSMESVFLWALCDLNRKIADSLSKIHAR